ncbi:MAG: hypothetical protein OEY59_00620 [Deltaproteobacteria bacterium]|nr:hypothetical protein [Deltaproteobacteria bacterium]
MSELLQKKTMVPIDLVRCHFTDKKGLPASQLVLNDAVMGVSSFQLPFLQRGGKTWMKLSSLINSDKKNKRLVLSQKDKVINDKKVFLAFILLGNSLIGGPKIHTKLRISKSKFDYYHLCPGSFKKLSSLNPFQTFLDNDLMRKEAFSDLGIDGLDEEVELIIDGVLLGRLPAAFTFLPKALKIVAPLISIPVKANWKEKISNVKVIDPVGNRKVMRSYYTEDN